MQGRSQKRLTISGEVMIGQYWTESGQTILLDFFTVSPALPDRLIDLTYKYLVEDHMIRD